ncbi:MAG: hypothetical protein R3231_00675 [bacterium]|nr:hypothetical protein [bacterium]
MKRVVAVLLMVVLFSTLLPLPAARAQSGDMEFLLRDTFYGALIGAFIGGLVLLTTDDKSDHLDYLVYGSLAGAVGGLGYGIYSMNRPLVEIERNRVVVGMPSIQGMAPSGQGEGLLQADLVRMRF